MDTDDRPLGRVLSRREAPGRCSPGCVVRPEQMEGPYFVDGVSDEIFADGGDQLMLAPERSGQGWAARFDLALQTG